MNKVLLLAALSTGSTALSCLTQKGFDVVLVTHDNAGASDFTPLLDQAKAANVPVILYDTTGQPYPPVYGYAPTPEYITGLCHKRGFLPDVGLVCGWSSLITEPLLSFPTHGFIGHHESLLPSRRGRAPLTWPVIHGASQSGVSFFWLTQGVDDGDIFAQASFPVGERDTAADMLRKANETTRDLLLNDVLPSLLAGELKRTPQNHTQATYCPRRTPAEGAIRWNDDADAIDRQVRALSKPYPGAFCWMRLKRIAIWESRPVDWTEYPHDLACARYGTVVWVSDDGTRQWVATGRGLLEIYLTPGRVSVGDRFDGAQYFEE